MNHQQLTTNNQQEIYDVAIVGGGVCGTSLLYTLSEYTNVGKIALIEKEAEVALINSNKNSNSQTLHFGDIETNYTIEKARKVNQAAVLVKNYLLQNDLSQDIYAKYHKMVLAVGKEQTAKLKARYQEFKQLFPTLRLIDRQEVAKLEPLVLKERQTDEEITALYTEEGYTINFKKLSQSFLDRAVTNQEKTINVMMETRVTSITKQDDYYLIQTDKKTITAKTVAVAAGAHSLLLAKSLGYGKDFALLSVAGSFYFAPELLNGKVYTVQLKKLPFAAIHGDPEVDNQKVTRFGPTAKVLPMLERHNYGTVLEYFQTAGLSVKAIASFLKILSDWTVLRYILLNLLYDVPAIGKRLFIKQVKKIVPSVKLKDLTFAKGYGGVRPQIVNLNSKSLELGEAKILGDNIIFNITPSPGASTCLQNASDDTTRLINFLGHNYHFDQEKFLCDLSDKVATKIKI
ncbi:putative dehydrogenase [Xenococcus sp. PCC 7305]|uniref:FAD-dependent oxidoreductase n=1 Tax=Xenococcus sp. PCC 7305 TaxID=102125 RepID=UPI0002ABC86C|nr:FAD-dependent oxidoreductase [Xenococcus sp. PCC 7305]ELS05530.1 putative dehydrogenase [Xenococcus sp. PCC 7305]